MNEQPCRPATWSPPRDASAVELRCPGCGASPGQQHMAGCDGSSRRAEPSPAGRGMFAVERAHTAYTSGRTSHTQYVAAIAAALTLWRNP